MTRMIEPRSLDVNLAMDRSCIAIDVDTEVGLVRVPLTRDEAKKLQLALQAMVDDIDVTMTRLKNGGH